MKLSLLLLTTFLGIANSRISETCLDPPGNNALAALLVNAIEAFRPLLSNGIPPLNIPPLDPFGPIPAVNFHIDTAGLRMDGTVDKTIIRNIAQFIICSLNITVGLTEKFAVEFHLDKILMNGVYNIDGLIASLFPVFGHGNFKLNTYNTGFSGSAKVVYNPLSDHASVKDLSFDVFFNELEMEMECINGCGDMSNLINGVISQIGPVVFDAVWNAIKPPLTTAIQTGINHVLKNISISDIITRNKIHPLDLGNGNYFVDSIMDDVNNAVVANGLDPAKLADSTIHFGQGAADFYDGEVEGLSKMHRSGTCTLDKIGSWVFLYANLGLDNLKVHYLANVTSGQTVSMARVAATVNNVDTYMVVRKDMFGLITDIDQFVITEFGRINVDIDGLGVLGFLLEPLTAAVMNLVREDIANLLEEDIKNLLQNILGETPWPPL